ncbi:hypothetical protein D1007_50586 [Hordeum vulgare]|uniref:Predicted protein n=1 Tax=Hordeum vulgare subsp. vulgare TaxID=112509 RepID=F2DEA2_HORVV|nr:hypothetical protein D1007_50586 [Hordeum vulgare]BAJ93423.1 predicted protein [Hordeum vulgare subsp. vulgare]
MILIHSNLTTQAARPVLSLICNSLLVDVNTCCAVNGQLVITRPVVGLHNRVPSIYLPCGRLFESLHLLYPSIGWPSSTKKHGYGDGGMGIHIWGVPVGDTGYGIFQKQPFGDTASIYKIK